MSNTDKPNKGMFSQENIQATLLPEPRYSARLEAKGKSRKPTTSNSEDVPSVVTDPNSSLSVVNILCGRHGAIEMTGAETIPVPRGARIKRTCTLPHLP